MRKTRSFLTLFTAISLTYLSGCTKPCPEDLKPAVSQETTHSYVCPACLETGCIYEEVDDSIDWSNFTDQIIEETIITVCRNRGITDPDMVKLVLSNYSL